MRVISPPLKVRLQLSPPSSLCEGILRNVCSFGSGSGLESPGGVTEVTIGGKKQRFPDLKGASADHCVILTSIQFFFNLHFLVFFAAIGCDYFSSCYIASCARMNAGNPHWSYFSGSAS